MYLRCMPKSKLPHKKKTIGFRVTPKDAKVIERAAAQSEQSVSDFVRAAVETAVERHNFLRDSASGGDL